MNPFSYAKRLLAETFGAEPEATTQSQPPDPYAALAARATPAPPFDPMDPIGSTAQFRIGQPEPTLQIPQQAAPAPQEPQAPQSPAKGFLQRMQDTPGMGLGLMQLGAGIASGKNWGEGLGAGFSGMADTLQKQKALDYQQKQQEADAEYKRQMLASRLLGKAGGSPGQQVQVKLKDGSTTSAFVTSGADGNPVVRGGPGMSVIDPSNIDGFTDQNKTSSNAPRNGVFTLPDGQKKSGQMVYDNNTGEWVNKIPGIGTLTQRQLDEQGITAQGESMGLQVSNFNTDNLSAAGKQKMEETLGGFEDTQVALGRFRDYLVGQPDGGERFLKDLQGQLKTFLGEGGNLTEEELKIQYAKGGANSLLGRLRTTIVGPGVMTEQDALRVLSALGGDPSSPTFNATVALRMIDNTLGDVGSDYNRTLNRYEGYGGNVYSPGSRYRDWKRKRDEAQEKPASDPNAPPQPAPTTRVREYDPKTGAFTGG